MTNNALRRAVRRWIPYEARWRYRAARRWAADRRAHIRLAERRDEPAAFPYRLSRYVLPVACYPGQEQRFAGKRLNIDLSLRAMDRLVVAPGETWSFWRRVGRPTRRAGYAAAAALKSGVLTEEVGGSICLSSTLLYNAGLLAGMAVIERYCHSVDSYGEARYFELDRDATVEHAYRDLRMRNDLPSRIMLRAWLADGIAVAEAWSAAPLDLRVELRVGPPVVTELPVIRTADRRLTAGVEVDEPGLRGIDVRTWRTVWLDGVRRDEDLGISHHEPRARRERVAAEPRIARSPRPLRASAGTTTEPAEGVRRSRPAE